MAASYPTSVREYTARIDLVDTVIADNVNSLQEEIKAVEQVLGSAATSANPLVSTYSGTFATTSPHATVAARLANIEAGLVNGISSSPYVTLATVTTAGDLLLATGSAAITRLPRGTAGSSLIMNGTTVQWGTPTDTTKIPLSTVTATGDLIVGSGNATVTRVGIGANGTVLTSNGTTTTWVAPVSTYVGQTNGVVTTAAVASGVVRNVYTRTTSPTSGDGAVGDLWVVYA